MIQKRIFTFLAITVCLTTWGQIPNRLLEDHYQFHQEDSGRIGFSLVNTNYMRNTEYFNPVEVGRTLFGYQLQPKFNYQPTGSVFLEGGLMIRHDFGGNNPFTEVIPTFTLKVKSGRTKMLFGTLEGALSHRMLEPMLNINNVIDRRIENGFQLKHSGDHIWLDTWINWEKFIEQGSPWKEQFTAGLHGRHNTRNDLHQLTGYYQFMASHQGGQIDNDTIDPFLMLFNGAIGGRYEYKLNDKYKLFADLAYLQFLETSDSKVYPQKDGNGIFLNTGVIAGYTNIILSYWNASHFNAPRGTFIYQSNSVVSPANYQKERQLVLIRFIRNKPLFGSPIQASARFEPVYDIKNGIFDFSYSLYLVYRGNWKFGKK